jgi:hypothetical protein
MSVRVYRPSNWGSEPKRTETSITELEKISPDLPSIMIMTGNGPVGISVGDQFPSRAGGRLILRVRWNGQDPGVFYYEDGKIYGHHGLYFWKDSWMEAFQTGAHWARGGAMIAKLQVELCMGIMAGAGGSVAHWALTATDVLHLLSEVDVKALIVYLPKVLSARKILKQVAPRLYDKLFAKFVDQMIENVGESLLTAATAHFVGRALGRLGRHVPGQLMKTIMDIAVWAGSYLAIRVIALAGMAANDLKTLALEMKTELAKLGIQLSEADAVAIIGEIQKNQKQVLEALKLLQGSDNSESKPMRETGFKV